MRNITISIDDETYRRARLWAAERDTSVSAIVKCILTTLPARAQARKPPAPEQPNSSKSAPPTPHPASPQSSPCDEVALVPAWGLTVLRATLGHLQSETGTKASQENAVLTCESVHPESAYHE